MKKIKGIKAFNKDMTCTGYQYEIDKEYKHDGDVSLCSSGFHFCENPLDTLNYYNLCESVFCEVEGSGKIGKNSDVILTLYVNLSLKLHTGQRIRMDIEKPEDLVLLVGKKLYEVSGYYPIKGEYISIARPRPW